MALYFGLWDLIGCAAGSFVLGTACAYAYMRREFFDEFDAMQFGSKRRNEVLEQAANYIEHLQGPRDSDFYAAAVREMKGVDS